jgi:hypothetical protein
MTHVRTSPYYPQSDGKIERSHKSLKGECIRPGTPLSLEDALRLVEGYVEHYNNVRLNTAIGYITPKDMLAGHQQEIQAERDRRSGEETAEEPPPAGRVTDETDYFRLVDYAPRTSNHIWVSMLMARNRGRAGLIVFPCILGCGRNREDKQGYAAVARIGAKLDQGIQRGKKHNAGRSSG